MASGATLRGRSLLRLSGYSTAAVAAYTFVGFDFNKCAASTKALGVAELAYNSGELVDVVTSGTAFVTLAATLALGAAVTGDASGFAVAASTNPVNGYLLKGGVSGDVVEVKLV